MDTSTFSILTDACRQAARAIHKTNRWLAFDDLVQEASAAALVALPKFDATRGQPLGGYLYVAAFRECKRLAWHLSGAATECDRTPTREGIARRRAASVDEKAILAQAAAVPSADEMLDDAKRRARIAAIVAKHLAHGQEGDAVRAVLFGELAPRQAADTFGVPVGVLYRATEKVRRTLKGDRRLLELL